MRPKGDKKRDVALVGLAYRFGLESFGCCWTLTVSTGATHTQAEEPLVSALLYSCR